MTQDPDASHWNGRVTESRPRASSSAPQMRVVEIFGPTLQGEGALIGAPTVFVRFGGCDYRCSWCDSLHAVLPEFKAKWKPMSPGAIVESVLSLTGSKAILVTLSGGNPALQPAGELIEEGRRAGLTFAMETQGSVWRPWMARLHHLVLSPKPPSSGEQCDRAQLANILARVYREPVESSLKVVVFDEPDLDFALDVFREHPDIPAYLQVGNPELMPLVDPLITFDPQQIASFIAKQRALLLQRLDWLQLAVIERKQYHVRVLPQLHTLLWSNAHGV